ncbi:MAG: proline--tRNA ligase [Candidatus Omnitrophica bacterium CG08_land_8_20_14_0_20_41_16]|uniref:Proline--tRNA ligase n=1 Tax=Candidatus Sherwoodlollariibacterium unditelluris TaxID=1974757 RepID=A0A2G9YM19_9BACT|nr:MAG: proline--tRNA ligase [Candidatus Omnitrophica bacterium CG23_combo_of_CG06-09_8_20_14_all_41_10]PIS33733.1 MAG: proline--tRNA ligase [Candidatus Omnitrophica bacterium CG08_land_8_20_14_0_20_41_16]
MRWTKTFIPTLKETPQEAESISYQLLLRAGLVRMLMAGVYSYLPLGLKVLENIQSIIRQEMNSCSASEVLLPALQPLELWQRSGRDKDIGEVMFRFIDRRDRKICLGPTHEEIITELVRNYVSSYKQLPLVLYQIQTKFRDEIRPRNGLIRACEFIMKDAYSFDSDAAGLDKNYQAMYEAYIRIFKRCGLNVLIPEADSGIMGGKVSHEFMVVAPDGEDLVLTCPKCKYSRTFEEGAKERCPKCKEPLEKVNAIEVGHIFKLGTKYSVSLGANFLDAKGKLQPIIMGCYGLGVSRLISAVIEENHDQDGIIWPNELAPYKVIIMALDVTDKNIMAMALSVYKDLQVSGIDVLLDDRDERAGVKFKDADLLGIPLQVIIGKGALKDGSLELKDRRTQNKIIKPAQEVIKEIKA